MFGVGTQELLIIGLLFLLIFGPGKAASMARDFGRFVSGAQNSVEEFKKELLSEEVWEARRTFGEVKSELNAPVQELKDEISILPRSQIKKLLLLKRETSLP